MRGRTKTRWMLGIDISPLIQRTRELAGLAERSDQPDQPQSPNETVTVNEDGSRVVQRFDEETGLISQEDHIDADGNLTKRLNHDEYGELQTRETFTYNYDGTSFVQRSDPDGNIIADEYRDGDDRVTQRMNYQNGVLQSRGAYTYEPTGTAIYQRFDAAGRMVRKEHHDQQRRPTRRFNYNIQGWKNRLMRFDTTMTVRRSRNDSCRID